MKLPEVMKFAEVMRDVEVDETAFAREIAAKKPADRCYVILFTPRSGSSWLTSILKATNALGRPGEYINPHFIGDIARRANSKDQLGILEILKRRGKSKTGVFGLEATSTHVTAFGEEQFFQAFDQQTVMFNLWRDNIVAQGVSLYRAVATQRFHSSDQAESTPPPAYDATQIRRWISHLLKIENNNRTMLDRRGIFPRVIRYEDIVRSKATTLSIFADALHVSLPEQIEKTATAGELKKVGDSWNQSIEQEFRQKEKRFIDNVEQKRLMRSI